MSEDAETWIATLPERAKQYSVIFVQLGFASRRTSEALLAGNLPVVPAKEFAHADLTAEHPVVVITGLDRRSPAAIPLGVVRERVMREAANGYSFILVSSIPKQAFEDTVGSDIIADARQIFAPATHRIPAESESVASLMGFYQKCVSELGDDVVHEVCQSLWEDQSSPQDSVRSLSREAVAALRGALLLDVLDGNATWRVSDFKAFRDGVALAYSERRAAEPWVGATFTELWQLERLLRNLVRKALVEKCGNGWRTSCIPDGLKDEVLERAQRDLFPHARSMSDVSDPLEWLTTSELLDVRERLSLGELGLKSHLWSKLRNEILPIRNRAAHMRVIRREDATRCATWRKMLERVS
ncbi:MAG: hypothetical protein U0Q15_06905 [Kineosporiaceae bacterium]